MKNLLLLALLGLSQLIQAQITEEPKSMSQGVKNALIIELPGVDDSFADKMWKQYVKPFGGKTKKNRSEWFSDDLKISGIGGSSPVDVYMTTAETNTNVEIAVWFDLGTSYLDSETNADQFLEAEKFLMRYALFVAKEKTEVDLSNEEKEMKRLENLLKRLERDNDRFHREIEVAKEKIRQNETNIETNVVEQEETRKLIELQLEQVDKVRKRLADLNK